MNVPATQTPGTGPYRCRRCGACCRWPGYVRLTGTEVDRIAAHLGLEPRAFVEQYTTVTVDRRSLTLVERPDGGCILLTDDNRCRVHDVKPRQCQGFPERWRFPGFEAVCPAGREAQA